MPTQRITKEEEQQIQRSLFIGPLIWFTHLNVINILTSVSCKWGWFNFSVAGLPGLRLIEMIISLIALLLLLYLAYLPWNSWRALQTEEPIRNPELLLDTEKDRNALLAFIAMLINSMFSVFVLATFVLLFALKACGGH